MGKPIYHERSTRPEVWRAQAQYVGLTEKELRRLEWIIFYYTVSDKNAAETARYFGISRKCLHHWLQRFDSLNMLSLREVSRKPHRLRMWEVTPQEEQRIVELRQLHMVWGKQKLKRLYVQEYGENISAWKIERVVRLHHLFPDPRDHRRYVKKRQKQRKRMRIHTLDTSSYEPGKLWHVDTIVLDWYGHKKSILTAIEDKTKLAYARVYEKHSSHSAADFLKRLVYLSQGDIAIVHSDNGSEFAGEFEKATHDLSVFQVYSRVRTPNDNPALERFNRTLQEEWLAYSETGLDDIHEANQDLTRWLIEYASVRPHASLDYQTPLEYAHKHYYHVLPMYPAHTQT